ncbi:Matrix non-peptidase-like protein 1 [Dirofilaria immitis]|nr:Matrix non-peptidase-like protein 1 [Dirofilaria immitis]
MTPPSDTFSTNNTNDIVNGTNTNIAITDTIDIFHKHRKWLTDKKQYITYMMLIILQNVGNRSDEHFSISTLPQTGHNESLPSDENSDFTPLPITNNSQSFDVSQCVTPNKNKKCLQIQRKNFHNDANIPSEDFVAHLGHFMGWRPKHYELNITINRDARTSFTGNIKAVETTSSISLHTGRSISNITLSQIKVHNCRTGEVYCIASIVYHQKDEVLLIEFFEPISVGHIILLQIKNFISMQASAGLIVKSPQKWEPKRPWTVTTFFQLRNARSVFPCFDLPIMKATMKMCINHPAGSEARSNTKILSVSNTNGRIESCFERTPIMSSYLYAFTIFDRMSSMKGAIKPNAYLPEIEVLYSEEDNFIKPDWISTEAMHALKVMENISDFRYPLMKLSLMASFLPVYGLENLGLIILDERFIAYPKYRLAHTILAHEVAQQWIGNIVTIKNWKEMCLQEGLSTYLEWIIAKSLDNSTEMDELIGEKRREGIMKDSISSTTIVSEFRSPEDISRCFDKPATFFAMLELGFGQGTVAKMIKLLMLRYTYANAGIMEWRSIIEEAANDFLAGEFFEKYFTQPGLPLIRVSVTAEGLKLTQNVTAMKRVLNVPPAIVPLDIAVIDVPERTPEVYLRFVQCIEISSCSVFLKAETMKRISDDFCWAFWVITSRYLKICPTKLEFGCNLCKFCREQLMYMDLVHAV